MTESLEIPDCKIFTFVHLLVNKDQSLEKLFFAYSIHASLASMATNIWARDSGSFSPKWNISKLQKACLYNSIGSNAHALIRTLCCIKAPGGVLCSFFSLEKILCSHECSYATLFLNMSWQRGRKTLIICNKLWQQM